MTIDLLPPQCQPDLRANTPTVRGYQDCNNNQDSFSQADKHLAFIIGEHHQPIVPERPREASGRARQSASGNHNPRRCWPALSHLRRSMNANLCRGSVMSRDERRETNHDGQMTTPPSRRKDEFRPSGTSSRTKLIVESGESNQKCTSRAPAEMARMSDQRPRIDIANFARHRTRGLTTNLAKGNTDSQMELESETL